MYEKSQISHNKICLTIFILSTMILMVIYYDISFSSFNSMPYTMEDITSVVPNDFNDSRNSYNTTEVIIETNNLSFNDTFIRSINDTSSITTYANITSNIATSTFRDDTVSQTMPISTTDKHATPFSDVDSEYLVSSPKCQIPNYQPFNKDAKKHYRKRNYTSCSSKKLLTYVTIIDNIATLYVDSRRVPSYSTDGVTCCYSNVTRVLYKKDPDNKIRLSPCEYFENNVTIYNDPVYVKCLDTKSKRQVYENVHVAITVNEDVQKKITDSDNITNTFSILLVGIDSISRLNFIRSLPKTHRFVEENGWIPLKGYNKIGDNTFPNIMAILTGYNQTRAYSVCDPKNIGKLDKCPLLWYDFRDLGYITGYAEDCGSINTFNYRKKGFVTPPVDYYYRPYVLATEKLSKTHKDGILYCTGPETEGERILNLARDFSVTFKNYSNFGFFWMNSFSHNDVNAPSGMDEKVKNFLVDITNEGVTRNSIVIFLSDHGMRFGAIRKTDTGWLEERLPFIYVSLPMWFKETFPKEYKNFQTNSYRLTSPYDLYLTLRHVLVLSGRNYNITESDACPTCKSLFEEAKLVRSCTEAGIEQHWCTCVGYKHKDLDNKAKSKLSSFVLKTIEDIIHSHISDNRCAKYSLGKILESRVSHKFPYQNDNYILLQVQTIPKAVFEITVKYIGDIHDSNFSISGDISRLDSYNEHSKCVSDAYLRKYCYCRSIAEKFSKVP